MFTRQHTHTGDQWSHRSIIMHSTHARYVACMWMRLCEIIFYIYNSYISRHEDSCNMSSVIVGWLSGMRHAQCIRFRSCCGWRCMTQCNTFLLVYWCLRNANNGTLRLRYLETWRRNTCADWPVGRDDTVVQRFRTHLFRPYSSGGKGWFRSRGMFVQHSKFVVRSDSRSFGDCLCDDDLWYVPLLTEHSCRIWIRITYSNRYNVLMVKFTN